MGAALLVMVLVPLALGTALVGALFVPAEFAVSAGTRAGFRLRVRWLFGLVRVMHPRERAPAPTPKPEVAPEERRAKGRKRAAKRRRRGARPLRAARTARRLLAIDGLVSRVWRLAGELAGSFAWRLGRISVRAGTGDPAGTGELCGLVGPLLVWLPKRPALRVEFQPDFAGPVFEAQAEAAGRFVPARVAAALGRFAVSRPGRRAIKVMVWDRGR